MALLMVTVLLGAVVLLGGLLQQHLRIPAAWAWIALGAALSFVPGLEAITLPSEVMLFLFLPVLLFWETLQTSTAAIRRNLRVVVLLGIGLVFISAAVVAGIGQLAGLSLAMALVLGAVVSPTDATAVAALADDLPHRNAVVLRGESLINDAGALALFTVAVAAASTSTAVTPAVVALDFVWAAGAGAALGLASGWLLLVVRRAAGTAELEGIVSLLTPFVLFLPAQLVGASGVVSVVAGGLLLSARTPAVMSATARSRAAGFWEMSTTAINGALFVLIGLQARAVVATIAAGGGWPVVVLGLAVAVVVLLVRFLYLELITVMIRALDRRVTQRARRVPIGTRVVTTWSGFRGAVSLAVALAIPSSLPGRDQIVAITLIVIVFTVVVQGGTLPVLLRHLRVPHEPPLERQQIQAEAAVLRTALQHLEDDAAHVGATDADREQVRRGLLRRLALTEQSSAAPPGADASASARRRLHALTLGRKRAAVASLRAHGAFDDEVLRGLADQLDVEDLRQAPGRTAGFPASRPRRTDQR